MNSVLIEIKNNVVKNQYLFVGGVVTFIIGVLLGLFLPSVKAVEEIFNVFAVDYFKSVTDINLGAFKILFSRLFNSLLLILFVSLLCTNIYTFYINFIIILYRGFIIGYTFIVFVISLGFTGIMTYLFLVLVQNVIVTFALILLLVNVYDKLICKQKYYYKILFNYSIISYVVCIIAAVIEVILIISFFKPINAKF